MEAIIHRQNQPFLVYSQGPALYLLALPLISPVRSKLIARDCQDCLSCQTFASDLIFLYQNTAGQVVLLFHNPETGLQRSLPLLVPKSEETYQDFFLHPVQGRLYFFYTAYTPADGRCRLYYKLPLEQLESMPVERLRADDGPQAQSTEIMPKERETPPVTRQETAKRDGQSEPDPSVRKHVKELETTVEHISAQYQELYDYTLALQKEARKWRDLARHQKEEHSTM